MNWNRTEYEVRRVEKHGQEKYIVYRINQKRSFVLISLAITIIYLSPFIPYGKTSPFSILFGIGVGVLLFTSAKIIREEGDNIHYRFILVTEFDNMESAIKYVCSRKQEERRQTEKAKEEVVYRSKDN